MMDNQFIAELAEKFIGIHIQESRITESFSSKFHKDFELLSMMHPEVDIMDELSYNRQYVRMLESALSDINKEEEIKTEEPKKKDAVLTDKGIEDLAKIVNKNIKNEEDLVKLYQTTDVIESINENLQKLSFPIIVESALRDNFNIKESKELYSFLKSFQIKPKKYRVYTNESKTIKNVLLKSKSIKIIGEGKDKKEDYGFVDFESYTTDLDPICQRMNPKEIDEDIIDDYEETPITTNKTEESHSDYLKWKRKNVTLRGISDESEDGLTNNRSAMLGKGLYTAPLSNKDLAKQYGGVRFMVNAIPKNPKIVDTLNGWELFQQNIINDYCKEHNGGKYDARFFNSKTDITDEVKKLGYDGVIIKGREMVNYNPVDVKQFRTEVGLEEYYEKVIKGGDVITESNSDYLKWKRKNITVRGISDDSEGHENNNGAMLGVGLYSVPLSNAKYAKQFGTPVFILGGIPKNPIVFKDIDEWRLFDQDIVKKYCDKHNGGKYDRYFFSDNTNITDEVKKLGYDGVIIKGREMVNYDAHDNFKQFNNEWALEDHYDNMVERGEIAESFDNKSFNLFLKSKNIRQLFAILKSYHNSNKITDYKADYDKKEQVLSLDLVNEEDYLFLKEKLKSYILKDNSSI